MTHQLKKEKERKPLSVDFDSQHLLQGFNPSQFECFSSSRPIDSQQGDPSQLRDCIATSSQLHRRPHTGFSFSCSRLHRNFFATPLQQGEPSHQGDFFATPSATTHKFFFFLFATAIRVLSLLCFSCSRLQFKCLYNFYIFFSSSYVLNS